MAVDTLVTIELAGVDRVEELRNLWVALHRHESDLAALPLLADDELSWQRRKALYLDRLGAGTAFLALAMADGAPVGYAFVYIEEGPDDTFPLADRYAELYSLSVAPQLRGRGIGTGLLDFVDSELARRSIYDLRVAVMAGNTDAQRLYERRGLRVAEHILYRFGER